MEIYTKGPILAFIQSKIYLYYFKANADIYDNFPAIFKPAPIDPIRNDGVKFIRVIGWRTVNNITHWIFTYTLDTDWGLNNVKLIPQRTHKLKFLKFNINKESI